MVANLPPSSTDLLLYKGYPSVPVTVLDTNARGYRLEHFPSFMHGEFGFNIPQGPCIICFVITSCYNLSMSASGISAHITLSISFGLILLLSQISMCEYGNPLFCHSTEYIQQHTDPNALCFTIKSIRDFSFWLKTRAVISCLSTKLGCMWI